MNKKILLLLFFLMLCIAACTAQEAGIEIENAWARPGAEGENSAIYLHITNHDEDDKWISARSPAAHQVELHRSMMQEDETMKMEQQEEIPLPSGETVFLEPGGLHVMLINLAQEFEPGDMISLTLIFQQHASLDIDVPVRIP